MQVKRPAILERLRGVQRAGGGWLAFCPAHNDQHKRSLSVGITEGGKTLLKCHAAGCTAEQITQAVNMSLADLGSANGSRPHERRREVAAYDYHDERGQLLYQVVRFEPKDFRPRRPDGSGGWIWNLEGVRRLVYRLTDLAEQARVFWVEGEKDVDRLWSLGLPATTSPSGAQSWRPEYAAQIQALAPAEIVVIPDHDVPGHAYASEVAGALTAAGLGVRLLELPGFGAVREKHGPDVSDWLDAGHTAADLEALAASAPPFTPAAGTAPEATDGGEPELQREGLDLALVWSNGVRFALTAIRDGRDGVRGELTVTQGAQRLSWGSSSLSSTQGREALRKKLEATAPGPPWGAYLEEASWRLTQAARQGEPMVVLTGTVTSPTRELLSRLLYEGEPTVIYGDGDTGKSLVAVTIAAVVHSGASLPFGLRPVRPMPAAYLDWETSRDQLEERLALVAAGLGIDVPGILYKRMTRPLVDEAQALAADFARRRIGLVVIDSKMFAVACGDGAAFHEPITAFYNALRLFAPAASLVLNHITASDARGGGPARPFGGAFAFNGPRLIWEAKRDPEVTDATAIAFTCRKANNLPRKPEPFGLRFVPGNGTITVYPFDLTEAAPQVVAGASITYRLRLALASGVGAPDALAEALGQKPETIKRLLRRLRDKGQATDRPDGSWVLVS
jgi:hypothetical protein